MSYYERRKIIINKKNYKNLKPFTIENAKYYGKKGGLASGVTRRKKRDLRKKLIKQMQLFDYIHNLSKNEYADFVKDFSEEQKQLIARIYRK